MNGRIDEVRVSDIPRSADWIKTSYNNQKESSTFYNMGVETVLTSVGLREFKAKELAGGFFLKWSTGYEMNNLGFHIYREGKDGKRVAVNRHMVAGTALVAGSGPTLTDGREYVWWDKPPKGSGHVRYYLEDVDLAGRRTIHRAVEAGKASMKEEETPEPGPTESADPGRPDPPGQADGANRPETPLGNTCLSFRILTTICRSLGPCPLRPFSGF